MVLPLSSLTERLEFDADIAVTLPDAHENLLYVINNPPDQCQVLGVNVVRGFDNARMAIISFIVDRILGFNRVPPTIRRLLETDDVCRPCTCCLCNAKQYH
jgi:hypothetical protein